MARRCALRSSLRRYCRFLSSPENRARFSHFAAVVVWRNTSLAVCQPIPTVDTLLVR
jgi:hypothetical protein